MIPIGATAAASTEDPAAGADPLRRDQASDGGLPARSDSGFRAADPPAA